MSEALCGTYTVDGNLASINCPANSICGINTQNGLFHCQSSQAGLATTNAGSASFDLACMPHSDYASNCHGSCLFFTSRVTCSEQSAPLCLTATFLHSGSSYATFVCGPEGAQDLTITAVGHQYYQYALAGSQSVPNSAVPSVTSSVSTLTSRVNSSNAPATPSTAPSQPIVSSSVGQPLAYTALTTYNPAITTGNAGSSTTSASPTSSSNSSSTSFTSSSQSASTPSSSVFPSTSSFVMTTSTFASSFPSSTDPMFSPQPASLQANSAPTLSTSAVAGLGAGVAFAGLITFGLVAWLFYRRRRSSRQKPCVHTLASNNGDYYYSSDGNSSTTPYLDHPYTPQMGIQELGTSEIKKLEGYMLSPNSEIKEKALLSFGKRGGRTSVSTRSNLSGLSDETATDDSMKRQKHQTRHEMYDSSRRDNVGLGIAELESIEKRR